VRLELIHEPPRERHLTIARPCLGLNERGFFGTPRGLNLATATTSAAFSPHLEQRIRKARSLADGLSVNLKRIDLPRGARLE